MARKRTSKHTRLYFGEGSGELLFGSLLIRRYGSSRTKAFTKRHAGGGSLDKMAEKAAKIGGAYDKVLLKADSDRGEACKDELAKAKAICKEENIDVCFSKPCLEGLFLRILDPTIAVDKLDSKECKRLFEATYIPAKHRDKIEKYEALFTQEILEEARKRIPELNKLINFFEK